MSMYKIKITLLFTIEVLSFSHRSYKRSINQRICINFIFVFYIKFSYASKIFKKKTQNTLN